MDYLKCYFSELPMPNNLTFRVGVGGVFIPREENARLEFIVDHLCRAVIPSGWACWSGIPPPSSQFLSELCHRIYNWFLKISEVQSKLLRGFRCLWVEPWLLHCNKCDVSWDSQCGCHSSSAFIISILSIAALFLKNTYHIMWWGSSICILKLFLATNGSTQ